jgi:hypothetical protein
MQDKSSNIPPPPPSHLPPASARLTRPPLDIPEPPVFEGDKLPSAGESCWVVWLFFFHFFFLICFGSFVWLLFFSFCFLLFHFFFFLFFLNSMLYLYVYIYR